MSGSLELPGSAGQTSPHHNADGGSSITSRNGHKKGIAGPGISKCPKQPLLIPLNLCSQETPPTPHFLLMNGGIKIFELQHQQLINV